MSRVFPKPNLSTGWKCPLCKTNIEKPVILVPIPGTEDGNNIQAEQFHYDCAYSVAIEVVEIIKGEQENKT